MKGHDFNEYHDQLDNRKVFSSIYNTPWYPGVEYATFSDEEYERRHRVTREKMVQLGLDVLIAPGGPAHWSFGGGMLWLSGNWNWHGMCEYVVMPLEAEPKLIYSHHGAHVEAIRRAIYIENVFTSHNGQFAEAIADYIQELGLEESRIGIAEADWRFHDYIPLNQYNKLVELLPKATIELIPDFFHELLYIKSPEEQEFVAIAGDLAVKALYAIRDRARPGVTEYQLAASASHAAMVEDGQVDFLIIGSTPMDNPAQVFGNPRPSHRVLQEGDIILTELALGFQGYTAQIGIPICVGEPTKQVRTFFDEIVLPGFHAMAEMLKPGIHLEEIREVGKFFRNHGAQSRPGHIHGMDLVTNSPGVGVESVHGYPYEMVLQPGMTLMLEPCPITPDGLLGLFYGHTFIITETGARRVTDCTDELLIATW